MCLVKINLPSRLNRILNIITLIISLSMSSFILYHCALCNVKIVSKFLVKGNVKTRIVVSAANVCVQTVPDWLCERVVAPSAGTVS